jgi:acyl carrier protein
MTEVLSPPLHDEVQASIAVILGVAPDRVVGSAALARDLGGTSLDFVELIMSMEEAFGIEISDSEAAGIVTVDDLEAVIRRKQAIR